MSGTPLDLTPFGSVLTAIGWLYWLLAVGAIFVAWRLPKTKRSRLVALACVGLAFGWLPARGVFRGYQSQSTLEDSMVLFKKRCEKAGQKIERTVDNVDGVLLRNVRPAAKPSDRDDPNWPDAALPDERKGDWYLRTFLFWEHNEDKRNTRGYLSNVPSDLPGYQFVDVRGPDGSIYRYRLLKGERAELSRELVTSHPARYAVSFVNLDDAEGRQHWIAGTRVSVTDTTTNEVIAEHVWYSIDPGQGSTAGFRSPWGFAMSCPVLVGQRGSSTRFFVDHVLKPTKGE